MKDFVGLEDDHQVIIYPLLVRAGKKMLVFLIFGSLFFALYGLFDIVTGHNPTLGWQVFLSFGLCFFIFILQFSWGSVYNGPHNLVLRHLPCSAVATRVRRF